MRGVSALDYLPCYPTACVLATVNAWLCVGRETRRRAGAWHSPSNIHKTKCCACATSIKRPFIIIVHNSGYMSIHSRTIVFHFKHFSRFLMYPIAIQILENLSIFCALVQLFNLYAKLNWALRSACIAHKFPPASSRFRSRVWDT